MTMKATMMRTMTALLALMMLMLPALPSAGQRRACVEVYRPVCAVAPAPCLIAPCPRRLKTFSNACFARLAYARIVHEGPCSAAERRRRIAPSTCEKPPAPDPARDAGCKVFTDGCNICQRTKPGAKPFCTKMACRAGKRGKPQCLKRF